MKGAVTVLQAILIFAISLSLVVISIPWLTTSTQKSMDMSEMGTIQNQMALCNDKLVETARTGTSSKCMFSSNRGIINAQRDGIYYTLNSKANVCDINSWAEVDKERHLESQCAASGSTKIYNLRWRWPSSIEMRGNEFTGTIIKGGKTNNIEFDNDGDGLEFTTLTVIIEFEYVEGKSGKIVDISRNALLEDKAILGVDIY